MSASKTIIISCAGMGNRLGIGTTKALVDIHGKPLIIRQLELLDDYDDIRIVVGYQAQKVIDTVLQYRKDILFVFNHEYKTTGTGASVCKAAEHAGDYILSLDGDLLVHPGDLKYFLEKDEEMLGGCEPSSNEPVLMETSLDGDTIWATKFSREAGDLEWTGLVQILTRRLTEGNGHVYQLLEPLLPLKVKKIRTREIDTMDDYENALAWYSKINSETETNCRSKLKKSVVNKFWEERNKVDDKYEAVRMRKNKRLDYDCALIKKYLPEKANVLDLGCGTGLIEEKIVEYVNRICAVDKFDGFFEKAFQHPAVLYKKGDAADYSDGRKYDVILAFGLVLYFEDNELDRMLSNCFEMLSDGGKMIIKGQWGIEQEVVINHYSEELKSEYSAVYRQLDAAVSLCERHGFNVDVIDLYPPEMNRWDNTHDYALVAFKEK